MGDQTSCVAKSKSLRRPFYPMMRQRSHYTARGRTTALISFIRRPIAGDLLLQFARALP